MAILNLVIKIWKDNIHITDRNVIGHQDIAPSWKVDPGSKFNWKFLAENGQGLWHTVNETNSSLTLFKLKSCSSTVKTLKTKLTTYGYLISNIESECVDSELASVFRSFN